MLVESQAIYLAVLGLLCKFPDAVQCFDSGQMPAGQAVEGVEHLPEFNVVVDQQHRHHDSTVDAYLGIHPVHVFGQEVVHEDVEYLRYPIVERHH